jgi:hypothetical protein
MGGLWMSSLRDRQNAQIDWMAGGAMGDVVEELHKEGHVSDAEYVACCRFLEDMRRSHGTSDGIVSQVCERVQTSRRERLAPPGGGDPDAFARVTQLLNGLPHHQRTWMNSLILKREAVRGSLSDLGRIASAYKTNKTTRAFAVGRITAIFASIAEQYA